MTASPQFPRLDLQAFDECTFDYDADTDIAVISFRSEADQRIRVDEGWYVRLAGRDAVGVELHHLRQMAYTDRSLQELLRAALVELDRGPNRDPLGVLADHIARTGDTESRPQLMRLGLALIGIAVGKYSLARE